jgi:hypothetical protein
VALKYWTQVRAGIVLLIAAVLALLAWQAPLALELQSRARWLADAQRAATMMETGDVSQWASIQREAASAVMRPFGRGEGVWSPEAGAERQRNNLIFGRFITRGPPLPPGLDVGVSICVNDLDQVSDPTAHMVKFALWGLLRVWLLLLLLMVLVPVVVARAWSLHARRVHGLAVVVPALGLSWSVVPVAGVFALVLSWGFFDRRYLWGWPAPQWRESAIIAAATFGTLLLNRMVRGLLDARDRVAAADDRCPACFYGPITRASNPQAIGPTHAAPTSTITTRRCPECGTETATPPPRHRAQRAATWLGRLTPVVLLIVACWWPIEVVGPEVFSTGLFTPTDPKHPEHTLGNYLGRWASMRTVRAERINFTTGRLIPFWSIGPPIMAGNGPLPVFPPTTPPPTTTPPPEPPPQTPHPPP